MKVIHVLRRMVMEDWGGAQTVLFNYCSRLLQRGYDATIFATSTVSKPGHDTIRGLPIERFRYFYPYIFLRRAKRQMMDNKSGNPVSLAMFYRLLREKNVDLVHVHSMGLVGAVARSACRLRGIPYVVSLHGGHFTFPLSEMALLHQAEKGALRCTKPFGFAFGARRILKDAAAILSVGYDEHQEVVKNVSPKTAVYLPNGVDVDRFAQGDGSRFREKYGLQGKRIILCVSRIDPQKGQLYLVQALPRILRDVPDAHLVIVGSTTVDSYYDQIAATLKQTGTEKNTLLIHGLSPDGNDLIDAYAACDVFALPSTHEPFGIVILEAWAAGKPVVAANVGGIPHFVTHGKSGLLFETHSVEGLADSVVKVLRDSSLARSLADNGLAEARRAYTWDRIVDRLTQIYDRVVKRASLDDVRFP